MGDENKPQLGQDKLEGHDNPAPGCHAYWENLMKLYVISKSATTSTEETRSEQRTRMTEVHDNRNTLPKVNENDIRRNVKRTSVARGATSDLFKNISFCTLSLVRAKQNTSNFHAFTMAFCAMAENPAPRLMALP